MTKNSDPYEPDAVIQQASSFQRGLEQITNISSNQVEFSIFCIENVAARLGISGDAAYGLLTNNQSILDEYVIPNYDMLHTQDKEYIVDDIIDYMKECGVLK